MNRIATFILSIIVTLVTAAPAHAQFRFLDVVIDPTATPAAAQNPLLPDPGAQVRVVPIDHLFDDLTAVMKDGTLRLMADKETRDLQYYTMVTVPAQTFHVHMPIRTNTGEVTTEPTDYSPTIEVDLYGKSVARKTSIQIVYECSNPNAGSCMDEMNALLSTQEVTLQCMVAILGDENKPTETKTATFRFYMNRTGKFVW